MIKRQIVVLNFLILAGIFGLTWEVTSAWEMFEKNYNLDDPGSTLRRRIASRLKDQVESGQKLEVQSVEKPQPIADFMVIPEKNLFVEDRQPGLLETPESSAEEQPPVWPARPVLRGVAQSGGRKQGLLTVFEVKPGQGQMRKVRLGDVVQGYTVSGITDSLVKLKWKDREEIIDMADAPPQAGAGATEVATLAVTVITVGAPPKARKTVASTQTLQEKPNPGVQVGVVRGQGVQASRSGQGGRGVGAGTGVTGVNLMGQQGLGAAGQGSQSPFGARVQGRLVGRETGFSRGGVQNGSYLGGQRFSRR